jgi:hypothetical protein
MVGKPKAAKIAKGGNKDNNALSSFLIY